MKSVSAFDMMAIRTKCVQFGVETDHERVYKFCTKHCLQGTDYKYGDTRKLSVCTSLRHIREWIYSFTHS